MTHIKLENISKHFGNLKIIHQLNLDIAKGEFLTLVGPSGCGKSTLLRIIAGLEPQSTGVISIEGCRVERKRPSERDLAMVFQSYALYPHLTVFENIAVPLRMRLLNSWQRLPLVNKWLPSIARHEAEIREQVEDVADTLGLSKLLDRKPGKLSGGQRQRVAVGRAIVRKPKAFLFDEPLSNLDAKLRVHMRAEITRLHQQLQTTFVYVTHDQAEAMTMSDRIAVMMEGEIIQIGTPQEVYHNPKDIRVAAFIGSPEINILTAQTLSNGLINFQGQLISIPKQKNAQLHKDQGIRIGFRPESISRLEEHSANTTTDIRLLGQIKLVENLGAELFVHLAIIDENTTPFNQLNPHRPLTVHEKIVIRLPHDCTLTLNLGAIINLSVALDSLLVFDGQGTRIDGALMLNSHDQMATHNPYSATETDLVSAATLGVSHG